MNLVTEFEKLDELEDFQARISSLEQRLDAVDNTSSRLLLEVERERNRAQQYLAVIEDKTREIDKLTVALRTADDEASQEREQQQLQHVLIARLRASVRLNRICVFRVMLIVLMTNFLVTFGLNSGNQTTCPDQAAPNGP
jgi:predicted RNase H-like nuclease (RuvC/YqgF family)